MTTGVIFVICGNRSYLSNPSIYESAAKTCTMLETTRYNLSSQEMMSPANPVRFTISVEIQAESQDGFDESLQRTVKENSNVLGFGSAEFED